nr:hypothetical protein [Ralstonia sp.]
MTPSIGIRLSVDGAARAEAALRQVQQSVGGLEAEVGGLSGSLGLAQKGLAAIGGAATLYAIGHYALGVINAADALEDLSQRTGVAVKTLAQYQQIALESDTTLDAVATTIQRLTLAMGQAEQGAQEQQRALQALGITARDPNEAFLQLADAVAASENPTRTAVELNRLLGRGYADMLPLLQQGSQGIRDAAAASESFADSMARLAPNAGEFNDNLAELRQNAAGAAAGILGVAVPAVNSLHDAIRGILQDASLLDKLFLASPIGLARIGYAARNRLMQQADDARRIAEGTMAVGRLQDGTQPTPTPTPTPPRPAGVTRPAADPLDALLRQTDVRQLQEFERMVGLLNRRFDYGARDADLYTQAMTRLVQTTFADQIRAGDEALRAQAQTMRDNADWAQLEEEHLQGTLDAIEAQAQAWRDAGRALEVEMRTPMEAANAEMTRLDYMLEKGVISWDTYARATIAAMAGIEAAKTATGELADTVDKDMERLTRAVEGWGASFTATMVDIVTGGKASFRDLADSIIADILRIHLQRTVTDPLVGFGLSVLEKMLPARAFGGPVIGGQPYLVGEQGPELFVPRASGSITPNNAIHAGASRTVTVNQVYNFNGPADRGVVMSAAQLGASMARQQIRDDMDRGRL